MACIFLAVINTHHRENRESKNAQLAREIEIALPMRPFDERGNLNREIEVTNRNLYMIFISKKKDAKCH